MRLLIVLVCATGCFAASLITDKLTEREKEEIAPTILKDLEETEKIMVDLQKKMSEHNISKDQDEFNELEVNNQAARLSDDSQIREKKSAAKGTMLCFDLVDEYNHPYRLCQAKPETGYSSTGYGQPSPGYNTDYGAPSKAGYGGSPSSSYSPPSSSYGPQAEAYGSQSSGYGAGYGKGGPIRVYESHPSPSNAAYSQASSYGASSGYNSASSGSYNAPSSVYQSISATSNTHGAAYPAPSSAQISTSSGSTVQGPAYGGIPHSGYGAASGTSTLQASSSSSSFGHKTDPYSSTHGSALASSSSKSSHYRSHDMEMGNSDVMPTVLRPGNPNMNLERSAYNPAPHYPSMPYGGGHSGKTNGEIHFEPISLGGHSSSGCGVPLYVSCQPTLYYGRYQYNSHGYEAPANNYPGLAYHKAPAHGPSYDAAGSHNYHSGYESIGSPGPYRQNPENAEPSRLNTHPNSPMQENLRQLSDTLQHPKENLLRENQWPASEVRANKKEHEIEAKEPKDHQEAKKNLRQTVKIEEEQKKKLSKNEPHTETERKSKDEEVQTPHQEESLSPKEDDKPRARNLKHEEDSKVDKKTPRLGGDW